MRELLPADACVRVRSGACAERLQCVFVGSRALFVRVRTALFAQPFPAVLRTFGPSRRLVVKNGGRKRSKRRRRSDDPQTSDVTDQCTAHGRDGTAATTATVTATATALHSTALQHRRRQGRRIKERRGGTTARHERIPARRHRLGRVSVGRVHAMDHNDDQLTVPRSRSIAVTVRCLQQCKRAKLG